MPHSIERFSAKYMTGIGAALKRSKLKPISHALDVFGARSPNVMEYLVGTWEDILTTLASLNGNRIGF